MDGLIFMNWTVAPLSPEQQSVMRNVAALFLRREDQSVDHVDFDHFLLEGRLYRKSKGLFVTMAGTFFHADLGTHRGVKWTSDFLLRAGAERIPFDDPAFNVLFKTTHSGTEQLTVDSTFTGVSDATLL
jgi:hypothetical protein